MIKKRHKLRLRKQVVICIPILLLITIFAIGFTLNKNSTFTSEINQNNEVASENIVEDTLKISETSYVVNFNNMIRIRQMDNTIIYYAGKFKLDVDKALNLAHKFTNNYESQSFKTTNIIAPQSLATKMKPFKSFEAGVVYFIRDLYRYPEKYGSSIAEMRLDETPTTKKNIKDGVIYLDNGLTFEQYLGKICDLYDVDKSIALAIVHEETGVMTSALFNQSNNIGGLRGYGGWMSFTTLEAGIIAHVISIKTLVDNYEIDMSSPDAIGKLSGIYVKGNINAYAESWTNKVTYFRENINQKDLFSIK